MAHESLRIFLSYSHVDYEWQRKITAELLLLGITVWADREIKPGDAWQSEIEEALASADIILLLISRDFLTSDFVTTQELPAALKRVQEEEFPPRIIPVLLRETTWKKLFGIENIHAIPRFERWVANIGAEDNYWPNEDAAIRAVAKELEEVVEEIEREHEQRRADEADYRMRVAEALSDDDVISPYERRSLEEERTRLGLSEKVAKEIEDNEMRRHDAELEKIRAYEAELEFAINDVGLPFDQKTQEELKKRKAKLGLKDDDVVGLVERVAARLESEKAARDAAAATQTQQEQEAEAIRAQERAKEHEAERREAAQRAEQEAETLRAQQAAAALQAEEDASARRTQEVAAANQAEQAAIAAEAARGTEESWIADLTALLLGFSELPDALFVAPDIPDRKTDSAYERYGVPRDEPILGLIDETAFGSAKVGLAFGVRSMWFKNASLSVSTGSHEVDYETFATLRVEQAGAHEVALGDDLSYNSLKAEPAAALLQSLQALIRERHGIPARSPAPRAIADWGIGQRVFALWDDSFYYPGTIVGMDGDDYDVRFDDGDESLVSQEELAPIEIGVGTRVSARYGGLDSYYPGQVDRREGESIHIKFDDGDEESTTISMIRIELP